MRHLFKDLLLELAATDPRVVVLFGDISVFLFREFSARYPNRFYNAGICENTLVSFAAGLSATGFYPFVHSIAPFITERSYEQIKLDVSYNQFGINIVSCGGSFDYAWDGATHHCYTDLALMRLLPHMEVMQPGSKQEFESLLRSQYANKNPSYIRIAADEHDMDLDTTFGKGVVIQDKQASHTLITAGPILKHVHEAAQSLPVNILYFHTIKPMDHGLIHQFRDTRMLIVHDAFGLHEAVQEQPDLRTQYHGLPDQYNCYYGTLTDIRSDLGLDPSGIRQRVIAWMAQ